MGTFPYDPVEWPDVSGMTTRRWAESSRPPIHHDAERAGFDLVTRGRRALAVSLIAEDVVDLDNGQAVSRRVRRIIRHTGGEAGLSLFGRGTLETADLRRIDLQTLGMGLGLLKRTPGLSGVLPVFWRTLATSHGRFALLYAGTRDDSHPTDLSLEIMGGTEAARLEVVAEVIDQFRSGPIGMIVHAAPDPGIVRHAVRTRASCLCLDFAGVDHVSPEGKAGARALIGTARQAAPHVLLVNLRPDWAPAAHEAGATHAVFAPMEPLSL